MLALLTKQPTDVLDYDITYADWIATGDTLVSSTATISPAGMTQPIPAIVSSPSVKVWVAGGTEGVTYTITVTTMTDGGRTKVDEFKIKTKTT